MSSLSSLCSFCGLPPRPNQKLRKCTRCNSVQYHDSTCQRKHYPQHKKICRQIAARREKEVVATTKEPLVKCKSIEGKGRSLVALSPLKVGYQPIETLSNEIDTFDNGLCPPLVQPTLFASMRSSRCAYCFQTIGESNPLPRNCLHVHCSIECRNLDKLWKNEQMASMRLISSRATSSMPSPTVLICCRIFISSLSDPSVMTKYNELCYDKDVDDCSSVKEGNVHLNIIKQCHQFLLALGNTPAAKLAHELLEPNPILAYHFVSRLTMNGFTISSAEQKSIGLGVYPHASMINHSCRPNAVQTFWLSGSDRHHPPMLQITMCRDVKVGEEVTISYCDVCTPRYDRRKELEENYKFLCDCALCHDTERDDAMIGLKCAAPGCCRGTVRSTLENHNQYHCETCGFSDFDESLVSISNLRAQLEAIDFKLKDENIPHRLRYSEGIGEEIERLFDSIAGYCNYETSWNVAFCADLFIHWSANALSTLLDEEEQLKVCQKALAVMNKSRKATRFCYDYAGNLSWFIKRGIEAKLRLFVNPMDLEALSILRDLRKDLLQYYPSSDEVISSLDESIRAYSFS